MGKDEIVMFEVLLSKPRGGTDEGPAAPRR
jgi:hypothetical protein